MQRIGPVTKTLINAKAYAANTTVDITNMLQGIQWVCKPTFSIKAVENSGASDFQVFIQTSPDAGTTKANVGQFTLLTSNGNETLIDGNGTAANGTLYGMPWGEKVYAAMVFNTTGNWTLTLKVHGQARGAKA